MFVERKRQAAQLPDSQRIPARVDGVMTDVVECEMPSVCVDTARRRPLIGGSRLQPGGLTEGFVQHTAGDQVRHETPGSGLGGDGTIGCLVRTGEAVPRVLARPASTWWPCRANTWTSALIGAAVNEQTLQFGGSAGDGGFVLVRICPAGQVCEPGQKDPLNVFYGLGPGDDLNAVAAAVASRINALSIAGLTAVHDGRSVLLKGPTPTGLSCEVFSGRVENTWSGVKTTVKDTTLTLSGHAKNGCAAFVTLNRGGPHPTSGAFALISEDARAEDIARALAAAINARAIPGVSAAANGAAVAVSGVLHLECDISSELRMGQPTNKFCSRRSKCCDDRIGTLVDASVEVDAALIKLDHDYVEKYRADVQDVGNIKGVADVHALFSATRSNCAAPRPARSSAGSSARWTSPGSPA